MKSAFHTRYLTGILALIFAGLLSGCVSVSAPKKVEVGGDTVYDADKRDHSHTRSSRRKERETIDKDEAYSIAKDEARRNDIHDRFRGYEIHDKKVEGNYWILFESKRPRRKDGWKNHFAVRVSKYGRARLYNNGSEHHSRKGVHESIKKDEAYSIARRLARHDGVRLRGYEIHDKEIDKNYWVIFESKDPEKRAGWKNHFVVRVGRYGKAEMYK